MEWKSILINIWFSWSYRVISVFTTELFYILSLTGIVVLVLSLSA